MLRILLRAVASLRRFPRTRYWTACFRGPHGERLQRSTKQADRRKAQKVADAYEAAAREARSGALTERQARKVIGEIYSLATKQSLPGNSISEFFTQWLERIRIESGHKTRVRYEGVARRFVAFLGSRADLSIAHLTSVDITRFRDHLAKIHSPASVNLALAAIQSALSRAFDDRLVDTNECARVRRLADHPSRSQQRRAFTEPNFARSSPYATMSGGDGPHFPLHRRSAWRRLAPPLREHRLQRPRVALQDREDKSRASDPDCRPALRALVIAGARKLARPALLASIRHPPARGPDRQLVERIPPNPRNSGRRREARQPRLARQGARCAAGIGRLRFHPQHSATSMLKAAGASDVVAREIIGHDSASVSKIYTHIGVDTLRAAVDKLPDVTKKD